MPVMLDQGNEGHVVNTSSGNGGFSPLINSAWPAPRRPGGGGSRNVCGVNSEIDFGERAGAVPVDPHAGHVEHRIWQPGKNWLDRYCAPARARGRDALAEYKQRMEEAARSRSRR
jgi:hypothetical protein